MLLTLSPNHLPHAIIDQAVEVLRAGGVIVYPTDTIYGIGCDIFNKAAVEKIYRLKKRDSKKPMSIICSDLKHISEYALVKDYAYRLMKRALPGPYTFILRANRKAPHAVISKNKTVGIRIPDNELCLKLVEELGHPIVTTSLNVSGEAVLDTPAKLPKEIANNIDLIIDAGKLATEASTIIDVSGDEPIIIRQGKGGLETLGL